MGTKTWSEEDEKNLRFLYSEYPEASATDLAKMIDKSKNAIIGKCHRMNLYLYDRKHRWALYHKRHSVAQNTHTKGDA